MTDDRPAPQQLLPQQLLGAAEIRRLAAELDLRPTKSLGQNFVHDANTVRRIVAAAGLTPDDHVLEVGPGLGSLTLALLQVAGAVTAVEIDPRLAGRLPETVAAHLPERAAQLTVITADALTLTPADLPTAPTMPTVPSSPAAATAPTALSGPPAATASTASTALTTSPGPTALVANLPYNIAVPVLLHLLGELPSIVRVLVMVQAEVADRLAAPPGSKTYGVPSVKAAWYGRARRAGSISRSVFWPMPGVDSALVALDRHPAQDAPAGDRRAVFAVIDAAFAQRRKTLRSALSGWAGSAVDAERILRSAGVDPGLRGEMLDLPAFHRIADARGTDARGPDARATQAPDYIAPDHIARENHARDAASSLVLDPPGSR